MGYSNRILNDVKLKLNCIGVLVLKHGRDKMRRICKFKGVANSVKYEEYEQFEYGMLDNSYYEYNLDDISIYDEYDFEVVGLNGIENLPAETKIIEIVEIFDWEEMDEIDE